MKNLRTSILALAILSIFSCIDHRHPNLQIQAPGYSLTIPEEGLNGFGITNKEYVLYGFGERTVILNTDTFPVTLNQRHTTFIYRSENKWVIDTIKY